VNSCMLIKVTALWKRFVTQCATVWLFTILFNCIVSFGTLTSTFIPENMKKKKKNLKWLSHKPLMSFRVSMCTCRNFFTTSG
jgi:hypothetical protein